MKFGRHVPVISLLVLAPVLACPPDIISRPPQYGIHAHTGVNTLLSEPNTAMEPALVPVLDAEARRLIEKTLPRAKTVECREKIKRMAAHIRERFDRHFARHRFAELRCPFPWLAPTKSFSQSESMIKPPSPLVDARGAPRCSATIAFIFQLHHGTNVEQLNRLLQKVLRPHHLYHFSLDSSPNPMKTDPDTGEQASGLDTLAKRIRAIVSRYGPVRYMQISRANVDVLYTGQSLLHSHILALRDLLRADVPPWDFVINLSAADYPIKSVEFMERLLAARGVLSWTESFLQVPTYAMGRQSYGWFIECPSEPCGPSQESVETSIDDECSGYVFHEASALKPSMVSSAAFGGSAFWTLHHDFVRYVWGCLAVGDAAWARNTTGNGPLEADKEADDAYCASVRGMYKWYASSFSPEETFFQTVLFNSQFCTTGTTGGGNQRWVSWREGDTKCNGEQRGGDYKANRPGCFAPRNMEKMARAWNPPTTCTTKTCAERYHQLFARKFGPEKFEHMDVLATADRAAAAWDDKMKAGLFACPGITTRENAESDDERTLKADEQAAEVVLPEEPAVPKRVGKNAASESTREKLILAICTCTRSLKKWRSLADTTLQTLLIPSVERTITADELERWDVRLYLGIDHDDAFWREHHDTFEYPSWLTIHRGFYETPMDKIPFNEMMRRAYEDGAEYLVRINDDTEFSTPGWITRAVKALRTYDPPNVGVVGPICKQGNTAIMTHDMVHRTHLEIFDTYYPEVFSAWWVDDWITKVYAPGRSIFLNEWEVRHHMNVHGTRYAVQHNEGRLLSDELEKGKKRVMAWLSIARAL